MGLKAKYIKGIAGLVELYDSLSHSGERYALSTDPGEDKWCVARSTLTLCVGKDTYERLGLVGTKLPFKGAPGGEMHGACARLCKCRLLLMMG